MPYLVLKSDWLLSEPTKCAFTALESARAKPALWLAAALLVFRRRAILMSPLPPAECVAIILAFCGP